MMRPIRNTCAFFRQPPAPPRVELLRVGSVPIGDLFREHPRLAFPFWSLYRFRGSKLRLRHKAGDWALTAHDLLLIPPHTPFRHPWSPGSHNAYIHCHISGLTTAHSRQNIQRLDDQLLHDLCDACWASA